MGLVSHSALYYVALSSPTFPAMSSRYICEENLSYNFSSVQIFSRFAASHPEHSEPLQSVVAVTGVSALTRDYKLAEAFKMNLRYHGDAPASHSFR